MTEQKFADTLSEIARRLGCLRERFPKRPEGAKYSDIPNEMRAIAHEIRELRVKYQQMVKGDKTQTEEKKCRDCKFWTHDMDDEWCGHPLSFAEAFCGRSLEYATRQGNFCGPERKLYQPRITCGAKVKGDKNAT